MQFNFVVRDTNGTLVITFRADYMTQEGSALGFYDDMGELVPDTAIGAYTLPNGYSCKREPVL